MGWQLRDDFEESMMLDAYVIGPSDTPYEGGVFRLEVKLREDYPFKAPKLTLLTPLYHPTTRSVFNPDPHCFCSCCELYDHSPALTIDSYLYRFHQQLKSIDLNQRANECCE